MVDQYNVVWPREAWERERDLYPHPISIATWELLRNVGLKYYEGATSLKAHYDLLAQLIHRCNVHQKAFDVSPNMWHRCPEEDIYFITCLSRRGMFSWAPWCPPWGCSIELACIFWEICWWSCNLSNIFSSTWWIATNCFFFYAGG